MSNVRVDLSGLEAIDERMLRFRKVFLAQDGRAESAAKAGARMLVRQVRRTILNSYASGGIGWRNRTGNLARSYTESSTADRNGITMSALSDSVYARIQDQGGVITPTSRKYLAIPIAQMAVGKWPRHFARGELVLIARPGKNPVLIRQRRRGSVVTRSELMFALARRVEIPAKQYVQKAAEKAVPEIAKYLLERLMKESVE